MDNIEVNTTEHPVKENNIIHLLKNTLYSNRVLFLVMLIYLILSLFVFYPITVGITNRVAGVGGDIYQMLWNNWWVGYSTFTLHQSIYSSMLLFWPVGSNLVYQTLIPIGSLIIYPLEAISNAFAYNVLFFLGIMLSGFTMFILSDYVVKNKYAAFIAGIIYTFSAFHIAQSYGHIEYANIEWIPLSIYFFMRIIKKDYIKINHKHIKYGKYILALFLSISFLLSMFMGDVEQGVMTIMVFVLIFLFYLLKKQTRSHVLNVEFFTLIAIFIVATFILGSWAFIPFITKTSGSTLNQFNGVQNNMVWSDDILSYFLPSFYNGIFNGASASYISLYHGDLGETISYFGYIAMILALYGMYKKRQDTYIWIFIGIIFFLLSLGPYILINNNNTNIPGLYLLAKLIPGVNIIREPGRFDLLVMIAGAIVASIGTNELFEFLKHKNLHIHIKKMELVTAAVISLFIIIEVAMPPLSATQIAQTTTVINMSNLYVQLGTLPQNFTVLVLPILPDQYSLQPGLYPGKAMFSTIASHKSIIGGYLTRENTTEQLSVYNVPLAVSATNLEQFGAFDYGSPIIENYTNQTLLSLYFYNTTIVTLDKTAYNKTDLNTIGIYLIKTFGAPIYEGNSTLGFTTINAIDGSLFKSYVSFPTLTDWNESIYNLNGQQKILWTPINGGTVTVYAPYNAILAQNGVEDINTTISINAISLGTISNVEVLDNNILTGSTKLIGTFNATNNMAYYKFNTVLAGGPSGNRIYFAYNNQTYPVGISNITFNN